MANPLALSETPKQPPDVSAQMGAKTPAFAGVGEMMAKEKPGGGGGEVSPTGAIASAGQAVESVIDNMAKMSEAFKPFANRIKQFLQAGIAEATKQGQGGAPQGGSPKSSAKAPEGDMLSFPG